MSTEETKPWLTHETRDAIRRIENLLHAESGEGFPGGFCAEARKMLTAFMSDGPDALLPLEVMPLDALGRRFASFNSGKFSVWYPLPARAVGQMAELYEVLRASAREATNPTPPSAVPLPESLAWLIQPMAYEESTRRLTELLTERDELRADRDAWRQVALHMMNGGR